MRGLFAAALLGVAACGYAPVHGGASAERFSVVLASTHVPDAVATDEVLAGVREELSRAGALSGGQGYPRCEVEVLRADEASEGISATRNDEGTLMPTSRATRVGLVARAWIVRAKDGPRERDTGDVRAMEVVSVAPEGRAAIFQQTDTLRVAGRRVGRRIGSHVLGLPTSTD